MLELTCCSPAPNCVLALYGRIAGPAVALLAAEGQQAMKSGGQLTLDLDGVEFIDAAGLALLRDWSKPPLVLRGGSPFVQALLHHVGLSSQGRT